MMSKAVHCSVSNRQLILRKLGVSIKRGYGTEEFASSVETEHFEVLPIRNEKLLQYEAGSQERENVKREIEHTLNNVERIPIVINGETIFGNHRHTQVLPFDINNPIASYTYANRTLIKLAANKAAKAQEMWDNTKLSTRMEIWEKAANLIASKYRFKLVATIMLGQGKTLRQAEMDVAELVDFIRISPVFLRDLANYEPVNNEPEAHNYMRFRGLTGFVAAISPFNYTSIAGNLAFTPALMGNAVLWKPSDSAMLSNWHVFKAMREAGLPKGVVNFVPASPTIFARAVTEHSKLAGINFTGTSGVLKVLWQQVAKSINTYENYPRLIGECGGKNFHFVHASADVEAVVACTIRAAFEYAGQKCSSCSMLYVPKSLWESQIKSRLLESTSKLFVSEATYCDCFYSAMINKRAYSRVQMYLKYIHNDPNCKVLIGGTGSKSRGYYIEPTIVELSNLDDRLCKEELLGPVLCVHVYEDKHVNYLMEKVAEVNHGLTGSVFATDRDFVKKACEAFKLNVGNLNINDKSTGSMVAQQPFGAGHMTGTNDKVGCPHYLLRWTSPQVIKESYKPHVNIYYPYMEINETSKNKSSTLAHALPAATELTELGSAEQEQAVSAEEQKTELGRAQQRLKVASPPLEDQDETTRKAAIEEPLSAEEETSELSAAKEEGELESPTLSGVDESNEQESVEQGQIQDSPPSEVKRKFKKAKQDQTTKKLHMTVNQKALSEAEETIELESAEQEQSLSAAELSGVEELNELESAEQDEDRALSAAGQLNALGSLKQDQEQALTAAEEINELEIVEQEAEQASSAAKILSGLRKTAQKQKLTEKKKQGLKLEHDAEGSHIEKETVDDLEKS